MAKEDEILGMFPDFLRPVFERCAKEADLVQEIRLRAEKPVIVQMGEREWFLTREGNPVREKKNLFLIRQKELEAVLNHMCRYSLYAFEEEVRQGFLTLPGGHRAGLAGQVIPAQGGGVRNIKHISCMNIRISHEIKGIADNVIPFLYDRGELLNGMILSPPGCGKTTMLRDIVRQISDGNPYGRGRSVGVVDERSEIAGCFQGIAQNEVGIRTDVLDGCPKVLGMMMLIRSMAPQAVAIDEIGSAEEVQALQQVLRCGSRLIVTMHGEGMESVRHKKVLRELLEEKEFQRFIVLTRKNGHCQVEGIYNQDLIHV